jgi:aminomethyltransferase
MEKKTPLYEEHVKLNGKIVPFGGWSMPVQYTNVIDEHNAVRNNVGLFDTCHMGEFRITGKDAFRLLQLVGTNNLEKLVDGKAMYTILCYENGTTIDDSFVYRFSENDYMLVVNASTIKKDFDWLMFQKEKNNFEVNIEDNSNNLAKIDVQGPKAKDTLQKLTNTNLENINRFHFSENKVLEINCIISRTGYTGEDGFELYFEASKASLIWNKLLEAGKEFNIKPCGLGSRDTLRLEACYSLYGHELAENITPIEAGLSWAVKTDKEFVGKPILADQKAGNNKRILVALEMIDRGIPREEYGVFKNNNKIGYITSGTFSPTLKKSIALALIEKEHAAIGTDLQIKIRDNLVKAKVVKKPFYEFMGK